MGDLAINPKLIEVLALANFRVRKAGIFIQMQAPYSEQDVKSGVLNCVTH